MKKGLIILSILIAAFFLYVENQSVFCDETVRINAPSGHWWLTEEKGYAMTRTDKYASVSFGYHPGEIHQVKSFPIIGKIIIADDESTKDGFVARHSGCIVPIQ